MRAFVALPVPEPIREQLAAVQKDLRVGRLTVPEDFHITLAFLGEHRPPRQVEAAHEALATLAFPAVTLQIDGVNSFGGARPRLVFAAIAPDPGLSALRRKVRSLLHGAGLALAQENFHPHVTLARLAPGLPAGDLAALAAFLARHAGLRSAPFTLRQVVLYHSTLGGKRALYHPLAEYPLI